MRRNQDFKEGYRQGYADAVKDSALEQTKFSGRVIMQRDGLEPGPSDGDKGDVYICCLQSSDGIFFKSPDYFPVDYPRWKRIR